MMDYASQARSGSASLRIRTDSRESGSDTDRRRQLERKVTKLAVGQKLDFSTSCVIQFSCVDMYVCVSILVCLY